MEAPDPQLEIARLQRRLARERAARRESEEISERSTRTLYEQQQKLFLLKRVAKTANESSELPAAIAAVLEAVRAYGSWVLGHAWLVDADGALVPSGIWAGPDAARHASFRAATQALRPAAGEGLPGRVLEQERPVWVRDFASDPALPRTAQAAHDGLRTALGFPVMADGRVVAVLEVFSEGMLEPPDELFELMTRIGGELGRVSERRAAADKLRHQATHDALTGLPNRVLIRELLGQALARLRRATDPAHTVAVLFVDLDGFKAVNDTLGHANGDRVLRAVAQRLDGVTRAQDTLGRLSGDEFIVVCDGLRRAESVPAIAERIAAALRAPFELEGELFQVTASVGVALARPGCEPEQLIAEADAAMYRAKDRGRNRWDVYSDELGAQLRTRTELERALRHAARKDELRLVYQPEVRLCDGQIVGVEALVRWERDGALVMPADFIPVAEETGLIVGVGRWVLDAALRQSAAWNVDPEIVAPPCMSVNLSVRQLADPGLRATVADALRRHGTEPGRLLLEVTESVLLDDVEAGLTVLAELKQLGTEIAIDDFGTGYASLSYLRRFPASALKIDRSFVATLDDPRTRAIVATMIDLSRALGLTSIAEGIETAQQLAILRELGCDLGQGYLFARPLEPAAATALLRGRTNSSTIAKPTAASAALTRIAV